MDGGMIGNGVLFGFHIADSPLAEYTLVGQIIEAEGLELEADEVDSDVHSTSRYVRTMPGKIEVGTLNLQVLANPDEMQGHGVAQEALFDLLESGETVHWRIEVPADRQQSEFKGREFDGWVKSFSESQPRRDGQITNIAIKFDSDTFERTAAGPSLLNPA